MRTAFLISALLLCSCVRNPATGKLELDLVSHDQEIQMGQQAKLETEQTLGIYKEKPALNDYVAALGKDLAAVSNEPQDPFSYEIVDDSSVNAFALPGGPIFVTRGILGYLNTEAELAAVMGHETGHVVAHHSANQISKAELAQVGLGIGAAISPALGSLAQAAGAGLQLLFLSYSRDDETQADELGFRFMTKAGYDPHQMLPLFTMLEGVTRQAGAGKTPEWLQTHPNPGNRFEATQQRLKTELKGTTDGMKVKRDEYLKVIDGIVFGEDPRQGYFKGDTFLDPSLKLQWTLPKGWAHQNSPQSVAGQSPKKDAIVGLQAAGKLSPEEAAQKLFSQQGVVQGQPVDVHGAKIARRFEAKTQQGSVEGVVAFIPYQGLTYMLLGYTAAGGLAAYGDTFLSSMSSFGELKDASALNAQPARVKIVHLGAPMSVEAFNAQYPSTIKPDLLALINGVEAGAQIPAGSAKQVVGGVGEQK